MSVSVRALRGATTVEQDDPGSIERATRELLLAIMAANDLAPDALVSAIFTMTEDLRSDFPARTARDLGWTDVPFLCTVEIPVPGSLAKCIRVLLHVETGRPRSAMRHVYLHGARVLRPDLTAD